MTDPNVEARYRAKIAARANGTTPVVVFPAGSGGTDDRYRAKIEARKPAAATAETVAAEESAPVVSEEPKPEPVKETPAKSERRKRDE